MDGWMDRSRNVCRCSCLRRRRADGRDGHRDVDLGGTRATVEWIAEVGWVPPTGATMVAAILHETGGRSITLYSGYKEHADIRCDTLRYAAFRLPDIRRFSEHGGPLESRSSERTSDLLGSGM